MNNVFILDAQNDTVLGHINKEYVLVNEHEQSLENTLSTFTMTCLASAKHTDNLNKRNALIVPGEDGELLEFRIFESIKYRDSSGFLYEVHAQATYLDLKNAKKINPHKTSSESAFWHVEKALENTEWEIGDIDFKGVRTLDFDDYTNPYDYLKRIAREFELELRFYIRTDGKKVTGRYVDLIDQIGQFRGRTIEFGRDLQSIKRHEKTGNVVTALYGIGPEKEDGTRLEVFVEDLDALERWGRKGKHIIDVYEPQSDRQDMTASQLRTYTQTELNKRINAIVTYEADIVDLENVPGLENKKIRFGDTIRIKDLHFNPPLYLEARIFNQKRNVFDKSLKTVELGDFVEYTEEEVKAIWKLLQEQVRQKISHYEMVEYTYDKLTIDDKDEITFENGKTFAEAVGIDAKEFAVEEDSKIKVDVESYADTVAQQKADSALDQAKIYAVAQEVYDIQMRSIANDIADRAPIEYVDGQLVDKANKGDVYTIADVDNMINNTVSITKYETDQQGIVTELESHGTRIGQNEEAIGFKADRTELDTMETELVKQIGNVDVKADSVITSVSEVRADLDGLEIGGRNLLKNSEVRTMRPNNNTTTPITFKTRTDEPEHYSRGTPTNNTIVSAYEMIHDDLTTLIKIGEIYTFSVDVRVSKDAQVRLGLTVRDESAGGTNRGHNSYTDVKALSGWTRIHVTFTNDRRYDRINSLLYTDVPVEYIDTKNWQLEKGNKATDWRQAPEDVEGQINNVSGRVSTALGEIETLAGEVNLKATRDDLDVVEGRVSTAEGKLEVLPGEINAKVSKDGAFGELNLSPDRAKLNFDRVEIDGKLEAKHIKSLNGLNVNDQFIVNNSGNVTFSGGLRGATGTFSGTVETARLIVNNPNVEQDGIGGLRLQLSQWQPNTSKPFKKTGYIDFNVANNALEIERYDENGNFQQLDGFLVAAKKIDLLGNLDLMPYKTGSTPKISLYANRSAESGIRWNANSSVDYGLLLRHEGTDVVRVKNDVGLEVMAGRLHVNNVEARAGNLFLRPIGSNEVRVVNSSATYCSIRAASYLPPSSSRESKKNIEQYNNNVIDVFRNTSVYTFDYKNEESSIQKRLGLMLDEAPKEIYARSGDTLDLYSMNGFIWKGLIDIVAVLDRHEKEIRSLAEKVI